jgi:chromate reductase
LSAGSLSLAWVSRVSENGGMAAAFGTPVFALGSASPGGFGGYRGLMALRNSLELQLGTRVQPAMVSVGSAYEAFDEAGELKAPFPSQMLARLVPQLIAAASPKA